MRYLLKCQIYVQSWRYMNIVIDISSRNSPIKLDLPKCRVWPLACGLSK